MRLSRRSVTPLAHIFSWETVERGTLDLNENIKLHTSKCGTPKRRRHVQFLSVRKLPLSLGLAAATHRCLCRGPQLKPGLWGLTAISSFLPALCVATHRAA